MNSLLIAPILGVVGMIVALVVYQLVMKYPDGEDKVKKMLEVILTNKPKIRNTGESIRSPNRLPIISTVLFNILFVIPILGELNSRTGIPLKSR